MTNAQMVTAITNSIQTDANLIILIRLLLTNNLPNGSTIQLQAACAALGIVTS